MLHSQKEEGKECGKSFKHFRSFELHRQKHIHIDTSVDCAICGKSFSQRSQLKIHEIIHKDKRGNVCRKCRKSFSQRATLRKHKVYTREKSITFVKIVESHSDKPII